jgi:hypothetical protein
MRTIELTDSNLSYVENLADLHNLSRQEIVNSIVLGHFAQSVCKQPECKDTVKVIKSTSRIKNRSLIKRNPSYMLKSFSFQDHEEDGC